MLSVVKGALEGEWSDDSCDVILTAMEKLIDGKCVKYVTVSGSFTTVVSEREREREKEMET